MSEKIPYLEEIDRAKQQIIDFIRRLKIEIPPDIQSEKREISFNEEDLKK